MDRHYLAPLFDPRSVAVYLPSTDRAEARSLVRGLAGSHFAGRLVRYTLVGEPPVVVEHSDPAAGEQELALIAATGQAAVVALEHAGQRRARAAIVLASGSDAALAEELAAVARRFRMHLLGPNTLGLQRPGIGLNAGVTGALLPAGRLALVSQSGALTSSIVDWASAAVVGFSAVVAIGSHASTDIAEVLDFLAADSETHSILIYLEGVREARGFMSALRTAARVKPVIVLKSGRHPPGSRVALTHSGAMIGADDVFDAALRRAGAVRVDTLVQLFSAARCLASRYRPCGNRLAIVTNGGGPAVLAADYAHVKRLALADFSAKTRHALRDALPGINPENPLDLGEEASAEAYVLATRLASQDAGVDGVLVILSPKPGADPNAVAAAAMRHAPEIAKPVFACWMGGPRVETTREEINTAGIPVFRLPEPAVDAFANIASFYQNQQFLLQTPPPLSEQRQPDIEGARILIESVLAERRKVLTEMESKALLSAFHIPVTKTIVARQATEAIMIAELLGFPVAMKINSPDISHKSDVGGVSLNLRNAQEVRDTYGEMLVEVAARRPEARLDGVAIQNMSAKPEGREIYIGVASDPLFGPVITFGAGGRMIELFADRSVELPPLNQFLAARMIQRSRVATILGEFHGMPPVAVTALEKLLLRVSEMVCELPWLREMDLNPVIVDAEGAIAVDARVVIDAPPPASGGRYAHLAILPYPSHFTQDAPLPDGRHYLIRAIRPDDSARLQDFVRGLSEQSRYFRYVSTQKELGQAALARYTLTDYHREFALVATLEGGSATAGESIIGVARYMLNPDGESCEFALVIADAWQGRGLGTRLMNVLLDVARSNGLKTMQGYVLAQNTGMLRLMSKLGFASEPVTDDPTLRLMARALI